MKIFKAIALSTAALLASTALAETYLGYDEDTGYAWYVVDEETEDLGDDIKVGWAMQKIVADTGESDLGVGGEIYDKFAIDCSSSQMMLLETLEFDADDTLMDNVDYEELGLVEIFDVEPDTWSEEVYNHICSQ